MAEQPLMPDFTQLIEYGSKLYSALKKIDFDPDVLCWAIIEDDPQLVLITSLADRVGPLEIYKSLYRAQDWGMIPSEFDLELLSIYSPHSELGRDIENLLANSVDATGNNGTISRTLIVNGVSDPWYLHGAAIYAVAKSGYSATDDAKRWRKIERNIAKMAA